MSRGIDHLVIAVHGFERARQVYGRLGFTLTPVARHPFGTQNSLVQLQDSFLELLSVVEPDEFPVPPPGGFSVPRFNHRYLERHEGISMLVLDSKDAEADARAFAEAGIQSFVPFEFGRDAAQPDGSVARVGFRLAFASDPWIPEAAFFTCQQLAPQHFWKPEYQRHTNTAVDIAELLMVSDAPSDHHAFFEAFAGTRDVHATSMGLRVETARGTIRINTPDAVRAVWGNAIPVADYRTPRFAGFTISVADITAAKGCLDRAGIAHDKRGDRLVVAAGDAMGAAVAFEPV